MTSINKVFIFIINALVLGAVHSWVLNPPNTIIGHCRQKPKNHGRCLHSTAGKKDETEEFDKEDTWDFDDLEVLQGDSDDIYGDDDEEDWIPDGEVARRKGPKAKHLTPANEVIITPEDDVKETGAKTGQEKTTAASAYTEEEEDLIEAMGGKYKKTSQREAGFLGDCTLNEIAMDYSVPICYMADVLCMWGVPVPINIHDRLGDLVTGEQAFALVEAVNSLDIGAIQDRYSNQNLLQICNEWDIDLKDAFEMAMKEGWSLPFGVRTNLRLEQEEELLRVFSRIYRDPYNFS